MADLLIDTDILIDIGRGVAAAVDFLDRTLAASSVGVSCITQMELLVGARDKVEQRQIERFLTQFEMVPITAAISTAAVELIQKHRLSHGLAIPDGLIAATVLHLNIPLATKNVRDFKFIKGLQLAPYP